MEVFEMKKTTEKSWKTIFLSILRPNIAKILFTIILLLILPIYPCKKIILCESIKGADCSLDLGIEFVTLQKVREYYPMCNDSLIYFPILLVLIYTLISIIALFARKKKW